MSTAVAVAPARRTDIQISGRYLRDGTPVHLVRDPVAGRTFEIGVKEHFVLVRLDGTTSRDEIAAAYAGQFRRTLGPAAWQQLLTLLAARGLIEGSPPPADLPPVATRRNVLGGSLRLVSDATVTTARLHRLLGFAFRGWFLIPATTAVLAMLAATLWHGPALVADTATVLADPYALTTVATILWVTMGLHELGHGVVAHHFGGTVGEIGIRWQLPMVVMYCRVDDYLFLPSRRQQVATASAGILVNLLLLLPVLPAWLLLPAGEPARTLLGALMLLGLAQAALYLLPLPPLDGYQMLAHSLGILHYASGSRRFAGRAVAALVGRPGLAGYPRAARIAFTAYALGAAALIVGILTVVALTAQRVATAHFGPVAGTVSAGLAVLIGMLFVLPRTSFTGIRTPADSRAKEVQR
ncbi:peptidase M50 [Micromonospora radicis]|uniref:Peptidase M50 n=1 Tax=Micromonospora radicis TaxID=1894971 RepID=A0A418MZH7_9ACTN|nr:peptidase M50 [Micromonospora radicis]RIV40364.1 peptidase M50 [Micromonospora radicis]